MSTDIDCVNAQDRAFNKAVKLKPVGKYNPLKSHLTQCQQNLLGMFLSDLTGDLIHTVVMSQ